MINSAYVGRLAPDIDPSDGTMIGLVASCDIPGEGRVQLGLPSVDQPRSKKEWQVVVAKFDADFDPLLSRVIAVRSEVASKVFELYYAWFPNRKWTGTAEELMSHMKLTRVNYYGDGTFALWFEGDEIFDCMDLNVELNSEWVADIVKFDG